MATPFEEHHPTAVAEPTRVSRVAWGLVAVVVLLASAAWIVTWRASDGFDELMMAQLEGAAPVDRLLYVALAGTMMVAMMLPSALPMVATYRGLALRDAGENDAGLRTLLFTSGYIAVWALAAALGMLVPMVAREAWWLTPTLLVGAGAYQFTAWKRTCLEHCTSPVPFLMGHYRSGHMGALRMGVAHARYCLGCCALLMLVLFAAGAMSLLWMAAMSALILAEKVAWRGARPFIGVAGIVAGIAGFALG